ncbi:CocE/NonD family hydrolase [Steroidobacter sp.]|uniref:CocE/NonD family hydrolase n=1 Tax=Steroidobacter sp. TaxID=1978227 RepID=UPI001A4183C1|nr:CocE/NonD family hydrolase [Steroidobacter sp.]MBL8264721.1 CocE/NonD family hydrolase [Steroidobacter sp.]
MKAVLSLIGMTAVLWMTASVAGEAAFDVQAHYDKAEYQIPMRDGVKLYTIVYTPKDTSRRYPILLRRTPYNIAPYGAGRMHAAEKLAPGDAFLREGYIFVLQTVRGRYKSEGEWENYRPLRIGKQGTDESTDSYDSIDWLIGHLRHHNRRVGLWGISHDGWQTVMGMIDPHPALKAASPQATTADAFIGDDFHHNGAFVQAILGWVKYVTDSGAARFEDAERKIERFDYGTPWSYEFFLNAGPVDQINRKYFGGTLNKQWDEVIEHPNYDAYWQRRNALSILDRIQLPTLNVLGWFDTADPYGSMATYKEIEKRNPRNQNTVVAGPWRHAGWRSDDGSKLGDVDFGAKTADYYREQIVFPFFQRHLKQQGDWSAPEAVMFETGNNAWHRFDQWPPQAVSSRKLYMQADHALSFDVPTGKAASACADYISDPAKPVPHESAIAFTTGDTWRIADQRLDATRPDVLGFQTEPLQEDVTIAGPIGVRLFASTTGTDSDWVVKVIDVHPGTAAQLPGYQQLVGMDLMRGRYRNSFETPEPMRAGEVTPIRFDIVDKFHTFKKGHRIRVHVQSSFFPYIDRNPQTFVDSIYRARPEDYVKATQRVCYSAEGPSHLVLPVLP